MKHSRPRLTLILGGLLLWAGCTAAQEPARETRNLSQPFNEVRLDDDIDLELSQADAVSLVIEAPREELSSMRSEVNDGVLTLGRTHSGMPNFSHWFGRHRTPRALLSTPAIERLVVNGSGNTHAAAWTARSLEVRISGSGDVRFDRLTATRVRCDLIGSGKVLLGGSVANQRIRVFGSGDYRAPDLRSQAATVSISGSGDVELWVERTLDARITGGGDIEYYGTPTVTKSVSGSGSITAQGEKN
jgi:putative autotransporter adhesin-like protein